MVYYFLFIHCSTIEKIARFSMYLACVGCRETCPCSPSPRSFSQEKDTWQFRVGVGLDSLPVDIRNKKKRVCAIKLGIPNIIIIIASGRILIPLAGATVSDIRTRLWDRDGMGLFFFHFHFRPQRSWSRRCVSTRDKPWFGSSVRDVGFIPDRP